MMGCRAISIDSSAAHQHTCTRQNLLVSIAMFLRKSSATAILQLMRAMDEMYISLLESKLGYA